MKIHSAGLQLLPVERRSDMAELAGVDLQIFIRMKQNYFKELIKYLFLFWKYCSPQEFIKLQEIFCTKFLKRT